MRLTSFGLPAALLAASLFGACSNTAKGVEQDTEQNAAKAKEASADAAAASERAAQDAKQAANNAIDATKDAAADAGQATKNAAEKTADATKSAAAEAGEKTKAAANSAGATLDGAAQTMQIKTALIADKSVDADHINVDTDGKTKVVTLRGTVKTAAEKATAARIAKSKAPDYRIVNELMVAP